VSSKSQSRKRGWLRFIVYFILIVLAFLFGGLLTFGHHVSELEPPDQIPRADGIVVWTGKGGNRLEAAGQLIDNGYGERLLISGVNPALSEEDVRALINISPDKMSCCVDIDYSAENTIGNARETHNWLKSLGYEHIILVTSAYHMPRAEIEISALSGRVLVTPYPVSDNPPGRWWADSDQRRRILREYGKLLVTFIRASGSETQREAPPLPDLDQQSED